MGRTKLNMRVQRKQITNIILDKTEFRTKVLHSTKKVHFLILNDSIHGEEALPEENNKINLINIS